MTKSVDVLIVGAGVVGLGIALELAEQGDLSVVVLDKGGPGAGASGRSAGVICRHDQGAAYQRLSLVGHARMQQLARDHGLTFNRWGNLTVVRADAEFPPHDPSAQELASAPSGMYEVEVLDRDATLGRFPWLLDTDIAGSVFEPNIGFIDPLELIDLYRSMLEEAPMTRVLYGTSVLGLERSGNRITRVLTRRGDWAPGIVINAAGAWGDKIAALAGSHVAITPQRVNVAVVAQYDEDSRIPLHGVAGMSWEGDGVWARGEVGGGALFGQHRELTKHDYPKVDPDFFDGTADSAFLERLAPIVDDLYGWPTGSTVPGWTCVYDTSPDGFPLIGDDVQVGNLIHAVGMNGHGMTIHAGVARCIAALVTAGSHRVDVSDVMPWPEEFDFHELRPSRFDDGQPLTIGRF